MVSINCVAEVHAVYIVETLHDGRRPSRIRPSRNEPALLPHVLHQVAKSLGKPMEEVNSEYTHAAGTACPSH